MKLLLAALLAGSATANAADVTVVNAWHGTLVATVVQRITFTKYYCPTLFVANRGSTIQDIYVRWDGTDPVAGADEAHVIMGNTTRMFATGNFVNNLTARVISTAAPQVSVECVD